MLHHSSFIRRGLRVRGNFEGIPCVLISQCDSFLAQHPEIQAVAQEEVDQVLGDSDLVTSEMEKELKYVTNCIKESQRLIPVITGFSRGAVEDTELGGNDLYTTNGLFMLVVRSLGALVGWEGGGGGRCSMQPRS